MEVLRTPDQRLAGLPGFPFAPHYTEVANAGGPSRRIHYRDPIARGGERVFQQRIPGGRGQPPATVGHAGHFLQEDRPLRLVEIIDAKSAI